MSYLQTPFRPRQLESSGIEQPAAIGTERRAMRFESRCLLCLKRSVNTPLYMASQSQPNRSSAIREQMEQIWDDLNAPNARAFRYVLAQANIPARASDIAQFIKSKSERAIFAPAPKYSGKVAGNDIDHRWQADLTCFTTKPARENDNPKTFQRLQPIEEDGSKPFTQVLLVQDLFSPYVWAVPQKHQ